MRVSLGGWGFQGGAIPDLIGIHGAGMKHIIPSLGCQNSSLLKDKALEVIQPDETPYSILF